MSGDDKAFPSPDWNGDWKGPHAFHGMSLRDYFAGQALIGILSTPRTVFEGFASWNRYAEESYKLADEMMKERKNDPRNP